MVTYFMVLYIFRTPPIAISKFSRYIYIYILRPHSRVTGNFAESLRLPRPKESGFLINFPNQVGCQARKSVPLLLGICASFETRTLPKIASCSGPDSHGNSVMELAEGRYAEGKSREAKEVANK